MIRPTTRRHALKALAAAALVAGVGHLAGSTAAAQNLSGEVKVDGSSTVYPITEAVAEEFGKDQPGVRTTVGISGTGGGFKRFATGETDVSNASRPIKPEEFKAAQGNGVEMIELPVAYDGLTVVVNPKNTFVKQLTVDELKKIFLEGQAAKTWKDVDPSYPADPIKIYSPGTDSGTFDYFKEVVAGKDGSIRGDMSVSEDDNVLVNGVEGDPNAIGFFGYAYYEENKDKLRSVPIVNDAGEAVAPAPDAIESGEYNPFSRPLFIYVNKKSAMKPEVQEFVEFYLDNAGDLASEVGYVSLPDDVYALAKKNFAARETGTHFMGADAKSLEGSLKQRMAGKPTKSAK